MPLASLDPPMVDRIRELMDQPIDREAGGEPRRHRTGRRRRRPTAVSPRGERRGRAHVSAPAGCTERGRGEPVRADAVRARPAAGGATPPGGARPAAARPAAIDSRLVSRRVGATLVAGRAPPARRHRRRALDRLPRRAGAPVSPRRLLGNSAHRRSPFGPHDPIAARDLGPAAAHRLPEQGPRHEPRGGQPSSRRRPRPVRDRLASSR